MNILYKNLKLKLYSFSKRITGFLRSDETASVGDSKNSLLDEVEKQHKKCDVQENSSALSKEISSPNVAAGQSFGVAEDNLKEEAIKEESNRILTSAEKKTVLLNGKEPANVNDIVDLVLNEKEILQQIQSEVHQNKITYDSFDHLFGRMPHKVQYRISDILEKYQYELVDEIPPQKNTPASQVLPNCTSNEDKTKNLEINQPSSSLNKDFIMSLIQSHVHEQKISQADFDNIFKMLSDVEKKSVADLILQNGIILTDDPVLSEETKSESKDTQHIKPVFHNPDPIPTKNVRLDNRVLVGMIQKGDKLAEQYLCIKNEPLVRKYANKFQNKLGRSIEIDDVMQYGMMGLLEGAKRFDLSKEFQFSTYATFWIKQSIERNIIDNEFLVRIPVHMAEKIDKVRQSASNMDLLTENKVKVTCIANSCGMSEDEVTKCLIYSHQFFSTPSLDLPVGEDGDTPLSNFVPDETRETPESKFMDESMRENVERLLSENLKPRECKIMKMRFGLSDGCPHTLEEIGNQMGVTRERIRQIEKKSLKKIRRPALRMNLLDYIRT
jgi:RNA polymerase primary sigma factor